MVSSSACNWRLVECWWRPSHHAHDTQELNTHGSETYCCWLVAVMSAAGHTRWRRLPSASSYERPIHCDCSRLETTRYQNTARCLTRSAQSQRRTCSVSSDRQIYSDTTESGVGLDMSIGPVKWWPRHAKAQRKYVSISHNHKWYRKRSHECTVFIVLQLPTT